LAGPCQRRRGAAGSGEVFAGTLSFQARPALTINRHIGEAASWFNPMTGRSHMSSLDFELDSRMDDLELEWRQAHETYIIARAEYLALSANLEANSAAIELARERLRRAQTQEARVFSKIELLEDSMLGLS
jgi:hypothetical protein